MAVIAASVHAGRHEREIIAFVKRYRAELERLSAAFISVTLSEAGVEDPARTLPVAGALTYTRYNVLVRFIMKRIARKAGGPTDTSRDYDFTNWDAIDRFAESVASPR